MQKAHRFVLLLEHLSKLTTKRSQMRKRRMRGMRMMTKLRSRKTAQKMKGKRTCQSLLLISCPEPVPKTQRGPRDADVPRMELWFWQIP